MLRFIAKEDYKSVLWENGRGVTSDIFLFPEGATRQSFDIRVSVAPITADAPFSLFTGIDRQITLRGPLEDDQLPERVRLSRLGESGQREEVEPVGCDDLLQ